MELKKADVSSEQIRITNYFKQLPIIDLVSIDVKWAFGINSKHRLNRSSDFLKSYKLFFIETKKLIKIANFGEMGFVELNPNQLFTGIDLRDFRIAKVLCHWSNGKFIDPPEIEISHLNEISFTDGRHRTIAAFHIGEEKIPVIIHKSFIEKISKVIFLDNSQNS